MTFFARQLRTTNRRDRARAFALPLVILLTLVAGLGIAVLFQRNGVSGLATRRQADGYILHHSKLGIMEMTNRWYSTVRGRLKESIDEDGLAFTLEMPDGNHVDILVADGQGTALSRTDALTGRRKEIVELMNLYLEALPEDQHAQYRRQYGPSQISVRTAPYEVLVALSSSILGPERAGEIADTLIQRVEDQSEGREGDISEVTRTLSELQIEPDQIAEFDAMLVATPTLWKVTAELRTASNQLLDRAGGLWEVTSGPADSFNQRTGFLSWDVLPLEEPASDIGSSDRRSLDRRREPVRRAER